MLEARRAFSERVPGFLFLRNRTMHQFNLQGTEASQATLRQLISDIQCPVCSANVTIVQDPLDGSFFADLPCECGEEPS